MPAASATRALAPQPRRGVLAIVRGPGIALVRRAIRDARVRTIAFASLFAIYAYVQPVGYRHAYPTLADRVSFAHSFGGNAAIRLFYGEPFDLLSVGGYSAWRVGGTLAIIAAVFGLLAAVRALRTEEETGRAELVLAGAVGRRTSYVSSLTAIALGTAVLWLGEFAGFLAGGLPAGGSAFLALATVSIVPVCVGVGAVASQLAPTRRGALELGGAVVAVFFTARVVADTTAGFGWLRSLTPLGWAEQLHPFAGPQPLVLLAPVAASAVLLTVAAALALRRDIGTGLLPARDSAPARLRLLRSPTAQALRSERSTLSVWLASVTAFALILGVISASISAAGISKQIQQELAKLGEGSILTPTGYVSFVFLFFVLALSLFSCAQVGAARHEEADQQLETLFAEPVGRSQWLGGRLALAAAGAAAISLCAGVATWLGATAAGVHVSFAQLLEAGANCLPVALLFLGVAALAYAFAPRASGGIAYALVTLTFLWQLVGSLLGSPSWLLDLSPFAHVGLVPAQPFRSSAALAMIGIGVATALAAIWRFRRRDLLGA